jgi:hypothetical protein
MLFAMKKKCIDAHEKTPRLLLMNQTSENKMINNTL